MREIKTQLKIIFQRREFIVIFSLSMIIILWNYILNIRRYIGMDVTQMPMFQELMVCSDDNRFSWFIAELYPLIVVIPAAFSIMHDRKAGTRLFYVSRCGYQNYYISKSVAVFIATFFCFVIPLMAELLLYAVTFPLEASGHVDGVEAYGYNTEKYLAYFWPDLYFNHAVIYCVLHILLFGFISATMAFFALSISVMNIKYMAFLLIPVYFLLLVGRMFHYAMADSFGSHGGFLNMNYADYLKTCHNRLESFCVPGMLSILLAILVISVIIMYAAYRKESL